MNLLRLLVPERTPNLSKPHAVICIKDSIVALLDDLSGDDLTITCDRSDCWADEELFKHRSAVNVVAGIERITSPFKSHGNKRLLGTPSDDPDACTYRATVEVDVQIYVAQCSTDEACRTAKHKAYSILSHVTAAIMGNQERVLGRKVVYSGSLPQSESSGDVDVEVVTASFTVHFVLDPTRPWVVG